jgi:hypothetical protein
VKLIFASPTTIRQVLECGDSTELAEVDISPLLKRGHVRALQNETIY